MLPVGVGHRLLPMERLPEGWRLFVPLGAPRAATTIGSITPFFAATQARTGGCSSESTTATIVIVVGLIAVGVVVVSGLAIPLGQQPSEMHAWSGPDMGGSQQWSQKHDPVPSPPCAHGNLLQIPSNFTRITRLGNSSLLSVCKYSQNYASTQQQYLRTDS